ncbi:meiosis protein SPO22/ZIP4 like-domain-containing protein [Mycena floridula]|nr:meiosis protein SPO22/ZIP4 like-domain-containing protein [Mycena floridula]
MSATRKKKTLPGLKQTFEAIKDLLTKTKARLDDPSSAGRASLIQDLHQVALLGEAFSEQRPRSNKEWIHLADTLDQEGVVLWNLSGLARKTPQDDGRALVGALRLAAFRLIEASLEQKPTVESLVNVLQLASKTGATISDLGDGDVAASVLTSAAKFEEMLRIADDPDGIHRQSRACATVVYYTSRMEAAWKEGNHTVADFMSQKITDDEQRLALLPVRDRVLLASKFHGIGKTMLKDNTETDGSKAVDALRWLQKAFNMADQLDDSALPGVSQLKITILRTLARAYFLSGSYERAEAALQELIPSIDAAKDHASSEYQELRWLRLAILKRRKAGEATLLEAFNAIVDHMEFSESNVTDVLQDLRAMSHQHTLATAVHQHFLQRALMCHDTGSAYVDRILLSLIVLCSKDENHTRATEDLEAAFKSTWEAEFDLPLVPATACLTLMWQYGDRHYHAKKWSEAAGWFIAGTHELFQTSAPTSTSKCLRKAALCYIEQREYARASTVIRRCPSDEAATHFIMFLAAVHQGLEEEAIKAVQNMQQSTDFERKLLLLATQLSHEKEMKTVLLAVLEALLKTLKFAIGDSAVEAMNLLRCIIRMVLKLLLEPAANMPVLIDRAVEHFRTAKILVDEVCAQKAVSMIIKDISWLWRTAYNCAVQGCAEWEGCEERISTLFDIARDLLEACCQASPVDMDADLYLHLINASFSGVSGRVFRARESLAASGTVEVKRLREIAAELTLCKKRIQEILDQRKISQDSDILRVKYFLYTLRVFEAEILAHLKDWERLLLVVTEAMESGPLAVDTYEAIADILWVQTDCPVNGGSFVICRSVINLVPPVLYAGLEAILRSSLDHATLSIDKFSRWLRAICTIILARNDLGDRVKAIGYIEQAITVMEEHNESDEPYPIDERNWLLATAYNTGHECVESSSFDEAKRWFESATVICKFVPGGKERAEKISESYTQLLSRYPMT